ncbi:MAG: FGGY family carbohydrate kinase, partial [Ruthenibacterium sp.]
MTEQYYLGVDIGTTAIKAALFDGNGHKILHHAQEYDLLKPSAQRVEQKPEVYWETFQTCVKRVMEDSGVDKEKVRAFAMDSSAETMVFLDEQMQPLDNFYVWMDNRATEEANEINACFAPEEIARVTGQTPIDPVYPATKIRWFRKNKPELFKRVRMMFMCDDYILWHMCGKKVSHGSSWCTSYLWDITQKTWWPKMLDYLHITPDQLPIIMESGTPVSTILPEIADKLGLPHNLLLV